MKINKIQGVSKEPLLSTQDRSDDEKKSSCCTNCGSEIDYQKWGLRFLFALLAAPTAWTAFYSGLGIKIDDPLDFSELSNGRIAFGFASMVASFVANFAIADYYLLGNFKKLIGSVCGLCCKCCENEHYNRKANCGTKVAMPFVATLFASFNALIFGVIAEENLKHYSPLNFISAGFNGTIYFVTRFAGMWGLVDDILRKSFIRDLLVKDILAGELAIIRDEKIHANLTTIQMSEGKDLYSDSEKRVVRQTSATGLSGEAVLKDPLMGYMTSMYTHHSEVLRHYTILSIAKFVLGSFIALNGWLIVVPKIIQGCQSIQNLITRDPNQYFLGIDPHYSDAESVLKAYGFGLPGLATSAFYFRSFYYCLIRFEHTINLVRFAHIKNTEAEKDGRAAPNYVSLFVVGTILIIGAGLLSGMAMEGVAATEEKNGVLNWIGAEDDSILGNIVLGLSFLGGGVANLNSLLDLWNKYLEKMIIENDPTRTSLPHTPGHKTSTYTYAESIEQVRNNKALQTVGLYNMRAKQERWTSNCCAPAA